MRDLLSEKRLLPVQMLDDLYEFSSKIGQLVRDIGIDPEGLLPDHIALRVNELQLAQQAHLKWSEHGTEISNTMINGRPIIVFEFDIRPLFLGQQVECLELPYPVEGKCYPGEGWEHVEFVVPSDAANAADYLDDLKQKYPVMAERWEQYPAQGITTKLSSPKGEGERLPNPTVAFKRNGICIKLHPWSLKQVIDSESDA